jgi:putative SOS response-associated peptidase YedK
MMQWSKQPICFEVNHGELFAFAGLWDRWRNPSGVPTGYIIGLLQSHPTLLV